LPLLQTRLLPIKPPLETLLLDKGLLRLARALPVETLRPSILNALAALRLHVLTRQPLGAAQVALINALALNLLGLHALIALGADALCLSLPRQPIGPLRFDALGAQALLMLRALGPHALLALRSLGPDSLLALRALDAYLLLPLRTLYLRAFLTLRPLDLGALFTLRTLDAGLLRLLALRTGCYSETASNSASSLAKKITTFSLSFGSSSTVIG